MEEFNFIRHVVLPLHSIVHIIINVQNQRMHLIELNREKTGNTTFCSLLPTYNLQLSFQISIHQTFVYWLAYVQKLTDLNCSCRGLIKIRPSLLVVRSLFEFQDVNCIQVQKLILDLTKHLKWTFLLEQLLILLAISEKVLSEMFELVLNIPLIFSNAGN